MPISTLLSVDCRSNMFSFEELSVHSHISVFGENAERVEQQIISTHGAEAGCVGAITHSTCI